MLAFRKILFRSIKTNRYRVILNNSNQLRSYSSSSSSNSNSSTSQQDDGNNSPDPNHPFRRTLRLLGNDMKKVKNFFIPSNPKRPPPSSSSSPLDDDNIIYDPKYKITDETEFQTHCDVLIIGGGGVGSSIAYWLKKTARDGLNVVVCEQDCTYKTASTCLSVGGLRQQFSLPENIQMSLFGADFIRLSHDYLGEDVDLNFTPYGYLVLASEEGAECLKRNSQLQNELGAKNELLTAQKLKQKFPWINTDGIALGCHGLEKEGWFDPWALLMGFKRRAREFGAHYVDGKVIDFEFRDQPDMMVQGAEPGTYEALDKVVIQMPNGEKRTIKFALCVIAGGAASGEIAKMARIGTGKGMLSVPLPVEPRKRYVYVFDCQGDNAPGLNTPLTIDPTNTYFRRDGLCGNYLGGRSPSPENEPSVDNLNVDYNYFDTDIWPILAKRVPAFESIKVKHAWSGYYEYNTFDENGIIGPHPYYHNLYIATGFSGHGIQQTPAVGRAISELIIDGNFRTIDLTRLNFDRIIVDQPMYEVHIV